MTKTDTRQKLNNLARYMQFFGDEPFRSFTGEIVGASFYDDEKGEIRPTPRLYIDMDEDIPVGHHRVYVIEVTTKKGHAMNPTLTTPAPPTLHETGCLLLASSGFSIRLHDDGSASLIDGIQDITLADFTPAEIEGIAYALNEMTGNTR